MSELLIFIGSVLLSMYLSYKRSSGTATGFVQWFNNPHYDERQKLLSAKGFTAAYLTAMGLALFYIIFSSWLFPTVSTEFVVASFFWLPTLVLNAVNIWTGAYFALNIQTQKYDGLFALLGLSGLAMLWATVDMMQGQNLATFFGSKGPARVLLMVLAVFVQVAVYVIRRFRERYEREED